MDTKIFSKEIMADMITRMTIGDVVEHTTLREIVHEIEVVITGANRVVMLQ